MAEDVRPPILEQPKRHVRRKMTHQEKLEYRRRRLKGACKNCVASKRKCNHDLSDQQGGISRTDAQEDLSGSWTESVNELMTHFQTPPYARTYFACDIREDERLPLIQQSHDSQAEANVDEMSLSMHKPQSPEMLSAMLFIDTIACEGVADAWFNRIPVYMGNDACLDQAIAALQMACWYRRRLPGATQPKLYRALAKALEALQLNMSSEGAALDDHTLASVAALSPVEAVRTGNTFLVPTHLDGMTSILVSRATLAPLSDMARRILEYHFCDTYVMASIRGIVSPLESVDEMYCYPSDLHYPQAERRIRAIGNKLCVYLPRLIALVRMACKGHTSSATVSSALGLTEELVRLKDAEAENEYLSFVGVAKTTRPSDSRISKYSLQFQTVSSFEAGTYYWHTRSTTLRLCRRLRFFFGEMCDVYSLPTPSEIKPELERCASNILMTAEFAQKFTARKRRRLSGQSLLACWGIYKDYPDILPGEEELRSVKTWILENINVALLGSKSKLTEQDLNDAAELFVGGPVQGTYKNLYDPP